MEFEQRRVNASELAPGMILRSVVGFSAEYAYLDRGLIGFLLERFPGASCEVVRKGATHQLPVEALAPLDALHALTPAPEAQHAPLDALTVESLREHGMRVFLVSGMATPPEPPPGDPIGAQAPVREPPAAAGPARSSGGRIGAPAAGPPAHGSHGGRMTEARALAEQVGQAGEQRLRASGLVRDMFDQGRAGRVSTQPAEQAVEEIVSRGLSRAMGAIAGLRGSDQTYAHCVDTSVIFQEAYTDILNLQGKRVNEAVATQTLLAGFSHDIGKSCVPKEVLDSTQRFTLDSPEMQLIRSHAAEGARILTGLGKAKSTVNVAHYHHVKLDGSLPTSYPSASWDEVMPLTRLAAVVDVYQALIGKRSYKKNWVPGKAVAYLKTLRGTEFDPQMLDYFLRVIGLYPVGSLVRLSTGDLAFVLAIGGEVLDRPVVAVVENAQGELLSHHTLIDLMEALDISVEEVVDHYEHYNADPEQAFQIFTSLNVG